MGGGFPNTELREVKDQRVFEFLILLLWMTASFLLSFSVKIFVIPRKPENRNTKELFYLKIRK